MCILGAKDITKGEIFLRTNGEPIAYSNWNGGEPLGLWRYEEEDCTEIYESTGRWNDVACYRTKSYICEKEKGTFVIEYHF